MNSRPSVPWCSWPYLITDWERSPDQVPEEYSVNSLSQNKVNIKQKKYPFKNILAKNREKQEL